MDEQEPAVIREAVTTDREFVAELMNTALGPYYGGDHRAHAQRILDAHLSGGQDQIGFFSYEQRMFILVLGLQPVGVLHLVGKRQGTYKISPLIVAPDYRGRKGLGSLLMDFAEKYAGDRGARQMYCTVAEQNSIALGFFLKRGYILAGRSDSHYKTGSTELMLYKQLGAGDSEAQADRLNISVIPFEDRHADQVRALLLQTLPETFGGIDDQWVDGLFGGYSRRQSRDINLKYKLIFVAVDRHDTVLGVAGATPKKGEPIKFMPFIAASLPAFSAMLSDVPYQLREFGRKVYMHVSPSVGETMILQRKGWRLDAAMPEAYHLGIMTQQWSFDVDREDFMRTIRVKRHLLEKIQQGTKTLEIRVGYDNIRRIGAGERIRFESGPHSQVVHVMDVRTYPSFDAMLAKEDYSKIAPGLDYDGVSQLLREIYPKEREELGVYVLDILTEGQRNEANRDDSASNRSDSSSQDTRPSGQAIIPITT